MNPTLKKYLIYAGVALALLATAFAIGRYTVPTKVIETVQVKEVEKQVVVEKVDEKKLEELALQVKQTLHQLSQLKKSIHREREKTKVTHTDGRTEEKEREVVDINVSRTVETVQVKEVEKQVVVVQEKAVEVEKQVVVEKEKVVEKMVTAQKPQWRAGPMVGVNLKELTVGQSLTAGPLSYGAYVERRIAGPVFAGAWGLNSGQVGLTVTVEF